MYKMLEFLVGVACGAKRLLYVTPKVTCSRCFCLFVIKMLEFPVGVACGAKKFLYFTPRLTFILFLLLGTRRVKQLKHFGPKAMYVPNKHLRKLKLCGAESQICATAN